MNFSCLADILDKQLELHSRLYELEEQKTAVLINGNTKELDSLLNQQQPLLMGVKNFEQQRETLQNTMGIQGLTITQLIKEYEEAGCLQANYEAMTEKLTALKRVSATNKRILDQRLSLLDFILTSAGVKNGESVTYSNK
ncbi:MAG: hypothetical protein BGN88_08865 [Clostridiales bacterium 43-6]|nr:MAG: hypothetical protein BGN88_08865 [Clostridiales bacterium 43-6]